MEAYHKANILTQEKEAWILENIGNIMRNQGFYSRAAEFLQQALKINPNSQYGHERLGQALKDANDQQTKRDGIRNENNLNTRNVDTIDSITKQLKEKLDQQPESKGPDKA
jgi:tetratricopeptide (TPR) repeat protein